MPLPPTTRACATSQASQQPAGQYLHGMLFDRLFAASYDHLIARIEDAGLRERRRALVRDLEGDVLEIGPGTGLNVPHYRRARRVVLVERSPHMSARLRARVAAAAVPVELLEGSAEHLPFPDASFDAVVSTLVLCSVDSPQRTLAEVRRVLKPEGRFVVVEHVRGDGARGIAQDALASAHRLLGAGCTPNRRTADTIRAAGFRLEEEHFVLTGNPDPLTRPAFQGVATKA